MRKIREGRLLLFGREDNPALGVPEEMVRRFASPNLDDRKWLDDFNSYTMNMVVAARQGKMPLESVVVDSMSELDLVYEEVFSQTNEKADRFAKWDTLLSEMFACMQRLNPHELNCHVIVTARVMEKKKGVQDKKNLQTIGRDPEFIDFDYYPSLRGSFRLHFPHYFNLVLYMETKLGDELDANNKMTGRKIPVHIVHMVRQGDFYVKNHWEHLWLQAKLPLQLTNPSFDDIVGLVEKATGKPAPNLSMLLYGGPGVGKTALGVSSFWNWKSKEEN